MRFLQLLQSELLFPQFTQFQTMQDAFIPAHVWNDFKVQEKNDGNEIVEYHRMDILWAYLAAALWTLSLASLHFHFWQM